MVLYYKEFGQENDEIILFLHGGGVAGWMWDKQVQYFKENYHCIVPDLPGHGQDNESEFVSIEDCAFQLIHLLQEQHEDKKKIVVGFSLGAQIAIQMLCINKNLINCAMINSALVRKIPLGKQMVKPSLKLTYPFIKSRSFSKLQAKTLYIGEDRFEQYFKESNQMSLNTLTRVLEENMSFHIPFEYSNVKTRLFITVGDKEKKVMKNSAGDLLNKHDCANAITISGIGHGIPLAAPEFFNDILENWLKGGNVLTNTEEIKRSGSTPEIN
ncbi:alpha/beta hydrolase [Psychrobacillus sp. AK 1817]|uniref:alpha/beta fold hydrolase n=1 Tax=Psychrobacillus sp. AK 1817 TaxID=2303505 RepID=UPI0012453BAF|nr:alpha/beta hydrolase [Psychrobacillus sp. AK 1817]QEY19408.1 alpha/beta hydrolase [Psychrobacillus sp. AK 1817]